MMMRLSPAVALIGIMLIGAAPPVSAVEPALVEPALVEKNLGGPCQGCELVFVGQPDALQSSARISPIGEPGETLVIEGNVRDQDGRGVPGIIVYAYQTNVGGIYPKAATRHGALRGWVRSGVGGEYRFDSIRPGSYPDRDVPEHVHMHVLEPDRGTYYIDDIYFDDDPKLTASQRSAMRHGRGGLFDDGSLKRTGNGWRVRRDIVLGAGIDGYPH